MRNVILGLDGVPFEHIQRFTSTDVMPCLHDIIQEGGFKRMQSSIPEISSVSWSSMITGKNPGMHHIFGFTDWIPQSYHIRFPSFNDLGCKPFWQQNKDTSVILNVPMTYPVQPLQGLHVSGFISLDLNKAVYPPGFINVLNQMNYMIDVDMHKAQQSKTLFLKLLHNSLQQRKTVLDKTWDLYPWKQLMMVITGTDRIGHLMIKDYNMIDSSLHQEYLNYYHEVDKVIGHVYKKMNPDDQLILLSDHGMTHINQNIWLNNILMEHGFLSFKNNLKKYDQIHQDSVAFCLEPGRVYLHHKDRFPHGSIQPDQVSQIKEMLIELFSSIKYHGQPVIKKIVDTQKVYHGPYLKDAPDLLLLPVHGYSLRGGLSSSSVFTEPNNIQGMHTQEDAFLISNQGLDPVSSYPCIEETLNLFNKTNGEK